MRYRRHQYFLSDMIIHYENHDHQLMMKKMFSAKIVIRTPVERNGMRGRAVFTDALKVRVRNIMH